MTATTPDLIRIPVELPVPDPTGIPINKSAIEFSSLVKFDFLNEVPPAIEGLDLDFEDEPDPQDIDLLY